MINISIKATVQSAVIDHKHVKAIHSDTVWAGVYHHLKERRVLTAHQVAAELFPSLPVQVCQTLLETISSKGWAREQEPGLFEAVQLDESIGGPSSDLEDDQMLKITYVQIGHQLYPLYGQIGSYKKPTTSIPLPDGLLAPSKHRPGILYLVLPGAPAFTCKDEEDKDLFQVDLALDDYGGCLFLNGKLIKSFGEGGSIKACLGITEEEFKRKVMPTTLTPDMLRRPEKLHQEVEGVWIDTSWFPFKKPERFTLPPNSLVNAREVVQDLVVGARYFNPAEARTDSELTALFWERHANEWQMRFEEVFPEYSI